MGNNQSIQRERDVAQSGLQNANATIDSLREKISSVKKETDAEKAKLADMLKDTTTKNTEQVSFFV